MATVDPSLIAHLPLFAEITPEQQARVAAELKAAVRRG